MERKEHMTMHKEYQIKYQIYTLPLPASGTPTMQTLKNDVFPKACSQRSWSILLGWAWRRRILPGCPTASMALSVWMVPVKDKFVSDPL